MYPRLFSIGPFTIYSYGLFIAIAVFSAYGLIMRILKEQGIDNSFLEKGLLSLIFHAFLFARIFYVLLNLKYYSSSFVEVFMFWEGGFVFSGGLIGGILWLYLVSKKYSIKFERLCDSFAPGLALGHAIGRIGCFFAGCCYGKVTEVFWAISCNNVHSLSPLGLKLHPVQLYSSAFLTMLSFFLYKLIKKKSSISVSASYLIIYGLFRIFIEGLRGDFRGQIFMGFTPTQWLALFLVISGTVLAVYKRKNSV